MAHSHRQAFATQPRAKDAEAEQHWQGEVSRRDHQLERLREHLLEMENAHTADALAREEVYTAAGTHGACGALSS